MATFAGLACISFGTAQDASVATEGSESLNVLLVTGGERLDFGLREWALRAGLEERVVAGIKWTVREVETRDASGLGEIESDPGWAEGQDLVILDLAFGQGREEWTAEILRWNREGLPAVLLGPAVASFAGIDSWQAFVGVRGEARQTGQSSEVRGVEVEIVAEESEADEAGPDETEAEPESRRHPVVEGVTAWTPEGELLSEWELTEEAEVVLTSASGPVAWVRETEAGRVFATSLGGDDATLLESSFLDLVSRAMLWAAGRLDAGAFRVVPEGETLTELKRALRQRLDWRMGPHLASDGFASASSEGEGGKARGALDDRSSTAWRAERVGPAWWETAFEGEEEIRAVAIRWDRRASWRYRIEGSPDGLTWRTLVEQLDGKGDSDFAFHEIFAHPVRRLRIFVLAGEAGVPVGIREVGVFGGEFEAPSVLRVAGAEQGAVSGESDEEISPVLLPASRTAPGRSLLVNEGTIGSVFATFGESAEVVALAAVSKTECFAAVRERKSGEALSRIVYVRDGDGDGTGDVQHDVTEARVADGGLAWDGTWLYVSEHTSVRAFRMTEEGVVDEQRELMSGASPGGGLGALSWGPGGWLYLAIEGRGENGAIDSAPGELDGTPEEGTIVRFRRDGSDLHEFAAGLDDPGRVAVSASHSAVVASRARDSVGEIELFALAGLDSCQVRSPSGESDPFFPRLEPVATVFGGNPGAAVWESGRKGDSDGGAGALLVALPDRDRIVRHRWETDGAGYRETGRHDWIGVPEPLDLAAAGDGFVFVASGRGFVARISPASRNPDATRTGAASRRGRDSRAMRAFENASAAQAVVEDTSMGDASRAAAVLAYRQLKGEQAGPLLAKWTTDEATAVRAAAWRALSGLCFGSEFPDGAARLSGEQDPAVLREMLVALGFSGSTDAAEFLTALRLTSHPDPVVALSAGRAIVRRDASHVCLGALDSPEFEAWWEDAVRILARIRRPEIVGGLCDRFEQSRDARILNAIPRALVRLYRGPEGQPWEGVERIDPLLRQSMSDPRIDRVSLVSDVVSYRLDLLSVADFVSLAEREPSLEPVLLDHVERKGVTPAAAAPHLEEIVGSWTRDGHLRLRAAKALARADDIDVLKRVFRVELSDEALEAFPAATGEFRAALFGNPVWEERVDWLITTANGGDTAAGRMAWRVLFGVHGRDTTSDAVRERIQGAVDRIVRNGVNQQLRLMELVAEESFLPGRSAAEALLEKHPSGSVHDAAWQALKVVKAVPENERKAGAGSPDAGRVGDLTREGVGALLSESTGSAARGRDVFERQGCVRCHSIERSPLPRGPHLGGLGERHGREAIARMILAPDEELTQGFGTWRIHLDDGIVLRGFVVDESPNMVEICDSAGNVVRLSAGRIVLRYPEPGSAMHAGHAGELSGPAFLDLVAYLASLRE